MADRAEELARQTAFVFQAGLTPTSRMLFNRLSAQGFSPEWNLMAGGEHQISLPAVELASLRQLQENNPSKWCKRFSASEALVEQSNAIGDVSPGTARVAVLATDYSASSLNGDAPAYLFNPEAERMGLDPWRLVEGVDEHVRGDSFDIWFADGSSKTASGDAVLYVSWADAERLAGEFCGEPSADAERESSVSADERAVIEALRDRGFAVTIFTPAELRGVDPDDVQDRLVELGNGVIDSLSDEDEPDGGPSF